MMKKCVAVLLAGLWCGTGEAAILFNEILMNPDGADDNREFIELMNEGGAGAVSNLWILQINGKVTLTGAVHDKWALTGATFGANGLLLIGNNYDDPPEGGPWSAIVPTTSCGFGDPTYFDAADILNANYTLLLVSNCSASVTNGYDLDVDDDGVFDAQPWDALLDALSWTDGDVNAILYSDAPLVQPSGTADAATRFTTNHMGNSVVAWFSGDIMTNETDTLGRTYDPVTCSANLPGGAYLTPGDLNYVPAAGDADGNGIPDWWEFAYFGGTIGAASTNDADSDGLTTGQEYVADTDPTNSASYFRDIESFTMAAADEWQFGIDNSSTGRLYDVAYSTNLLDATWTYEGIDARGTAGQLVIIVTNSGPVRFFRTLVKLP
ncbi:MAG: hypothetical protein E4H02_00845 [Lentisphaerales bacterium]|jgi:hypothetical protein|nr:MAG: hypothetical protein E4H02_00845 [Lentisphaerales bacterium]